MAVLKSKQLPTRLSGSYVLSGSNQTLHGTTTIHGNTTVSGSVQNLKGSSADFRIRQDDDTTLVKLETDSGGSSALLLYDNKYHGGSSTVDINSADSTALVIKSGSSTIFTVDRDNTLISGSSTSTGSFGQLETSDVITVGANKEIYLNKSEDTYIQSMAGDIARVVAGGFQMLLLDKDTGKRAVFGNGVKVYIGADNTKQPDKELVVDGDISGSLSSTGSFGTLETAGEINASGRIFEQGSSVIDHATAMAIVFGG